MLNVLLACEESQKLCKEFRKLGHKAFSCDLQKSSGGHPEWHIKGNVLDIINGECDIINEHGTKYYIDKWDLIIAFPPCTNLAISGAKHFEEKRKNGSQYESIVFFSKFLNLKCEYVAIENPVNIIGGDYIKKYFPEFSWMPKPNQYIQPYEYGNASIKKTGLWIKNLPNLTPTKIVKPKTKTYKCNNKTVKFSKDYCKKTNQGRAKQRSKTYLGIARAMAKQWSEYIEMNEVK